MKIEKSECSYQVTECDLKHGEQITLDGELLISVSVLDNLRAEIDNQYKWLLKAGCDVYKIDIAFGAIKEVLTKSKG